MAAERLECDHIELDRLFDEVFTAIGGADCAEVFQRLDLFWARLAMHIRAEHLHLFPAVRWLSEQAGSDAVSETAGLPELLDELRRDHDLFMVQLARAIKAMRLTFHFGNGDETLTFVSGLLDEVRDRLAIHNRNEETRIYILASEAWLPADMAAALRWGIDTELSKIPPRFRPAPKTGRTT